MKWVDKELVPGTKPPMRIGRRVFRSTDGTEKATETFWATFSVGGKQRFVSLEVFKRDDAFRAAHRLPDSPTRANGESVSRPTQKVQRYFRLSGRVQKRAC